MEGGLSGTVLVVEDTPAMQVLLARMLEKIGLDVVTADNGQEAVGSVQANSPDLILMDIQMPVMDGIEATAAIRELGYTMPIIAVTANVMQSSRINFEQAGGNDYLNKPVNGMMLLRTLGRYLAKSSSQ